MVFRSLSQRCVCADFIGGHLSAASSFVLARVMARVVACCVAWLGFTVLAVLLKQVYGRVRSASTTRTGWPSYSSPLGCDVPFRDLVPPRVLRVLAEPSVAVSREAEALHYQGLTRHGASPRDERWLSVCVNSSMAYAFSQDSWCPSARPFGVCWHFFGVSLLPA